MRVLLIEDDVSLADGTVKALRRAGYAIDHAATGSEGRRFVEAGQLDIVILDLGLPDIDGLVLLRELRLLQTGIPILILTARDSLTDKVAGLDAGADDYLTKPFAFEELLARIRVLSRRNAPVREPELKFGNVLINIASHEVRLDGEVQKLSRREFAILRALADRPGQVFSREQLEEKLYSWGDEVTSNTVDVHVHNLRKKLGHDLIKNIRGVGFVLGSTG
ncbi:response regulator [Zhongshania sp.]|jgi:DNA-binding response OmpR family regulator|uniref:response regulator n=1 Tax=Zhongshania sp. TaxID=1971902 RepID=UPI001B43FB0B|nr:response regulator [Zhongshania sp.]MBQ0796438.1 response regulator [Zhongshania sp.]